MEGFIDDTLTCKRCVSMEKDGHHLDGQTDNRAVMLCCPFYSFSIVLVLVIVQAFLWFFF